MFIHPQFDPVAISIGSLSIHWYGLMYLLGFVAFIILARKRLCWFPAIRLEDVDNLLTFAVIGVILGGRLGYVLFYKPAYYMTNPLEILAIWEGGMSFHGGFVGVLLTCYAYARYKQWHFLDLTDFVAPAVPIGLALGRLGNFINGELWGRPTDSFLGVIFPQAGDLLARHPSQLYQMFLEGFLLFVVLWIFASKPKPRGAVSSLFLIGYGLARFVAEFAREPDRFLGTLSLGLTMGQWLCLPMLLAGLWLWRYSQNQSPAWFSMNGGVSPHNQLVESDSTQANIQLTNEPSSQTGQTITVKQNPSRHREWVQNAVNAIASISIFGQKNKAQTLTDMPKQNSTLLETTHPITPEILQDNAITVEKSKLNSEKLVVKPTEETSLKNIAARKTVRPVSIKTNKRPQTGKSKSVIGVEAKLNDIQVSQPDPKPLQQKSSESIKPSATALTEPVATSNSVQQQVAASNAKQTPARRKVKEAQTAKMRDMKLQKNDEQTNQGQLNQEQLSKEHANKKVEQAPQESLASQSESMPAQKGNEHKSNEQKAKARKTPKVQDIDPKPLLVKKDAEGPPKMDEPLK